MPRILTLFLALACILCGCGSGGGGDSSSSSGGGTTPPATDPGYIDKQAKVRPPLSGEFVGEKDSTARFYTGANAGRFRIYSYALGQYLEGKSGDVITIGKHNYTLIYLPDAKRIEVRRGDVAAWDIIEPVGGVG